MPPEDFNLYARFRAAYAGRSDEPMLFADDGRAFGFRDLDALSARLAHALESAGVAPGDRVSAQVEKSPEGLCLYLACLRAGFVFHPLNLGYKRAELEYFVGNAEPAAIVCDPRGEATLGELGRAAGVGRLFTLAGDGGGSLLEEAAGRDPGFDTRPADRDQLAALLYSSGTTGVPKGIMLSYGNLVASTETLVRAWGFSAADRLLHALPIYHVHGLFVATGCALASGASLHWLAGFDAKRVVACLPECSVMMGVPTYYTRLLAEEGFGADVCAGMRLFVSGSAPLLEETFRAFEERTGQRILERYGMTETSMNTSNPLRGERKPGSVGPPLPGVELRVVDDAGAPLPDGEIGQLQVRGANVFPGYWRLPEKTAEDFTDDGYFRTGDLGRVDADGYVSIVGRSKDLVISGGLNVYPKEVEGVIDAVAGVRESAVIGVPHADFGEGVVAVVVPEGGSGPGEGEILAACRQRLADYKVPKRVVFADALPRNAMAKVQKSQLREAYAELLS